MSGSLKGWRTTRSCLQNTFRLEDGGTNILPDRHLYLATIRRLLQQRHFVRFLMYKHPASTQNAACHVASHTDVAVAAATGGGSPVEIGGRCVAEVTDCGLSYGGEQRSEITQVCSQTVAGQYCHVTSGGQCPLPAASVHPLCEQNATLST
jgi:hypothetical protein